MRTVWIVLHWPHDTQEVWGVYATEELAKVAAGQVKDKHGEYAEVSEWPLITDLLDQLDALTDELEELEKEIPG